MPSRQEKGSYARGGYTEDNLGLGTEGVAERLVGECLSSASRAMEKENLAI
jgi:hypothetical protein